VNGQGYMPFQWPYSICYRLDFGVRHPFKTFFINVANQPRRFLASAAFALLDNLVICVLAVD